MKVQNAPSTQSAVLLVDRSLNRDVRLDLCRGIALWFAFLNHVPDNIASWLTSRPYGFSDSAEVFMFVSGATCALAYGRVRRRDGWFAVAGRTLRRSWEIYLAYLILIIAFVIIIYLAGDAQFADATHIRILLDNPGAALTHTAILQYRPVNTDALPNFIVYHLLFVPLLWSLFKSPNVTLCASLCLYLSVQVYGWNLPQWPMNDWYFNPFAWQVLVVLGAWWVLGGGEKLWSLLMSRIATCSAAAFVLFSLVVTLSWSIPSLEFVVPPLLAKLIYPIDKSDLDPLRLLHFLAIAVLVARFARWGRKGPMTPLLRGAVRCGENSLAIYCLGVLLAFGGEMLLARVASGIAMQIAISIGGIILMIAVASFLTWLATGTGSLPPRLGRKAREAIE
jgi:hypothetical protein